jgi:hypothetical protein
MRGGGICLFLSRRRFDLYGVDSGIGYKQNEQYLYMTLGELNRLLLIQHVNNKSGPEQPESAGVHLGISCGGASAASGPQQKSSPALLLTISNSLRIQTIYHNLPAIPC